MRFMYHKFQNVKKEMFITKMIRPTFVLFPINCNHHHHPQAKPLSHYNPFGRRTQQKRGKGGGGKGKLQ